MDVCNTVRELWIYIVGHCVCVSLVDYYGIEECVLICHEGVLWR